LSESELSELKSLREKIDRISENDESVVDMKMGPSYKTVQPRQYKVEDDDFPRTNQYDPQIQENEESSKVCDGCGEEMDIKYFMGKDGKVKDECDVCRGESNAGFEGQEPQQDNPGYRPCGCEDYPCCGHGDMNEAGGGASQEGQEDVRGNEGEYIGGYIPGTKGKYKFVSQTYLDAWRRNRANPRPITKPTGRPYTNEAGGGAVQHSSYRTIPHGNLPQNGKQRWENDIDEGQSKVSRTISRGQKPKTSTKVQSFKYKKPKKTSSGVHKRKT